MLLAKGSKLFFSKMLTIGSACEVFSYQTGQKKDSVKRSITDRNVLRLSGSVANGHYDAINRLTLNPTGVIFKKDVFAKGTCKAEFLTFIDFSDTGYNCTNGLGALHETVH